MAWPTNGLRRASINCFGFGGTNAHVIVDDAYHYLQAREISGNHCTAKTPSLPNDARQNRIQVLPMLNHERPDNRSSMPHIQAPEEISFPSYDIALKESPNPKLFIWSAADEGGIARLCKQFNRYFNTISTDGTEHVNHMENLAYTLNHRRGSLAWKSYTVAGSLAEMQNLVNLHSQPIRSSQDPKLTFIFTGQGAQWPKMGRELLVYPFFKKVFKMRIVTSKSLDVSGLF